MTRFSRFGFYVFLAVLALAPILGGTPTGPDYAFAAWGGDSMSGVLRTLVFAAALLTATLGMSTTVKPGLIARIARLGVYGAALCVALSLLIHSRFFTVPVYSFAMVPETLNWLAFALMFALAVRFVGEDKTALRTMAIALLVGGAICALIGIMNYGAVPLAERGAHRESATFFSPNFAAGFAALILPVTVALFLAAEGLIPSAIFGVGIGLLVGLLMITGSRAGLALMLAGLAIALIVSVVRGIRLSWARVGIVVAIVALFGVVFNAPIVGRVSGPNATATTSGDHSGAFRKETWKGSLAMAVANPAIGAGPGTFPYTYPRYARVGWTGQAHSSYLQVASESGFPVLVFLVVGIMGTLTAGFANKGKSDTSSAIFLPALLGGIVAALGRSFFDSEWMLLGCGIPFFATLGMVLGSTENAVVQDTTVQEPVLTRVGNAIFLAACLVLSLMLRAGEAERDAITVRMRTDPGTASMQAKEATDRVRPADPQLYALAGEYETAAYLSPSGKRLYQLARVAEKNNDWTKAIAAFQKAVESDPNNLQTRKALAEAQAAGGDSAGTLATYQAMTKIAEGPAGTIRAIPELPDTLPAFAYTAVAEDALKQGKAKEADAQFAIAQSIVESYANTPPLYQLSEALTLGDNVTTRRAEVRALYTDRILPGRRKAIVSEGLVPSVDISKENETATLARLDAFATINQNAGTKP